MPRSYVKQYDPRHNWRMPTAYDTQLHCHDCPARFDLARHLDAEAWAALSAHMKRCRPRLEASAWLAALKLTEKNLRLRVCGAEYPGEAEAVARHFPSEARDVPDHDQQVLYGDGKPLKMEAVRR